MPKDRKSLSPVSSGEKAHKRVKRKEASAVETVPDAWERFEKAVNQVAPPKHAKPETTKPGT